MKTLLGIDIGGTKCAASIGALDDSGGIRILAKKTVSTARGNPDETIKSVFAAADAIVSKIGAAQIEAVGISCGGPLDSRAGTVNNPPNLPGWNNIPIVKIFSEKYAAQCALQNDANACALAEWKFGAARGLENVVFMTFGTGLGAGLILDGRLYSGTNDNAGEVGHIRLSDFGPVGYGKAGSFEGFCSGSGIAQLAKTRALEKFQTGGKLSFCGSASEIEGITAKRVAEAAEAGDPTAREIYATSGRYLGIGLSIIIDMLNPQAVVIGSVFTRSRELLWPHAEEVIRREALSVSAGVCKVLPAALGDDVGDYAALSVAAYKISQKQ